MWYSWVLGVSLVFARGSFWQGTIWRGCLQQKPGEPRKFGLNQQNVPRKSGYSHRFQPSISKCTWELHNPLSNINAFNRESQRYIRKQSAFTMHLQKLMCKLMSIYQSSIQWHMNLFGSNSTHTYLCNMGTQFGAAAFGSRATCFQVLTANSFRIAIPEVRSQCLMRWNLIFCLRFIDFIGYTQRCAIFVANDGRWKDRIAVRKHFLRF